MFLQIVTVHPNPNLDSLCSIAEKGAEITMVRSNAGFFVGPFQSEEKRESFKNAWLKDWVLRRKYNASQVTFTPHDSLPESKTAVCPECFGSAVGFQW